MNILITGGAGFFGRHYVRAVLSEYFITHGRLELPEKVCIYSRGEHSQAEFRSELGDDARCRWFIGDVRDRDRLRRAFEGIDLVVHAAALKRIEVGYYNPLEMKKTNIDGSSNVIEAAIDSGVGRVVALSSDKAFQPVSPYGASKALAESLFLSANNMTTRTKFSVCRYGNVWGSTGSIVPIWRRLIKEGVKELPVTDPDCTRFFMTIKEAVQLVMDTSGAMPGDVMIPDLPAYRIGDLAEAFGLPMKVTGLNHWEKKHEGMSEGRTSDLARRMTVDELREALNAL